MKLILSAIAVVIFLIAMLIYKSNSGPHQKSEEPQAPITSPATEAMPPPLRERSVEHQMIIQPEELAQALRVKEEEPKEFDIDEGRLFDKSYENDPEIIALAELAGRTPTCLIESYKDALAKIGVPGYQEMPANQVTIPRQSRGLSICEPLKAA